MRSGTRRACWRIHQIRIHLPRLSTQPNRFRRNFVKTSRENFLRSIAIAASFSLFLLFLTTGSAFFGAFFFHHELLVPAPQISKASKAHGQMCGNRLSFAIPGRPPDKSHPPWPPLSANR